MDWIVDRHFRSCRRYSVDERSALKAPNVNSVSPTCSEQLFAFDSDGQEGRDHPTAAHYRPPLSTRADGGFRSGCNVHSRLRAEESRAVHTREGGVPDTLSGEEAEQVHDGRADWRGKGVFDVLGSSAQVGPHDDSVLLQLMKLLNQDLRKRSEIPSRLAVAQG